MLAENKYQAYLFYDDLIEKNMVAPAAIVLKDALRKAYIDSFSISQTKPYGASGEFNPMIQRVKQVIDDIEMFLFYASTPYKQDTGESDRTTRLNSLIWQQESHGKGLHGRLARKLNECKSMEDIKAWLNITKEATQLMVGLKAATRGSADMTIEEDDDLHHLQNDLDGLVSKANTADECLRLFKLEFGEM